MRTTRRLGGVTTMILVLAASLSATHKPKTQPRNRSAGARSPALGRTVAPLRAQLLLRAGSQTEKGLLDARDRSCRGRARTITSWCGLTAWSPIRAGGSSSATRMRRASTFSISRGRNISSSRVTTAKTRSWPRNASRSMRRTISTSQIQKRARFLSTTRTASSSA